MANPGGRIENEYDASFGFSLTGIYQHDFNKVLGATSGLGLVWHRYKQNPFPPDVDRETITRNMLYAQVPIWLNIKVGEKFWFELGPTVHIKLLDKNESVWHEYFQPKPDVKLIDLHGHAGFRFVLYEGLSLGFNYSQSLMPWSTFSGNHDYMGSFKKISTKTIMISASLQYNFPQK